MPSGVELVSENVTESGKPEVDDNLLEQRELVLDLLLKADESLLSRSGIRHKCRNSAMNRTHLVKLREQWHGGHVLSILLSSVQNQAFNMSPS